VEAQRRKIAQQILTAARAHDERQADRHARFRNVEPQTAELLGVLVRATGARRILELGGSNGYSTIWLADAAQATGGAVLSVEIDAERTALAAANLVLAGVAAELRTQDAAQAPPTQRTAFGTSFSLTPSGPPMRATGRRCCAACARRAAFWQSTMSSPTPPRWRRSAS
jgi:predicted O-methyltransferase YrrM